MKKSSLAFISVILLGALAMGLLCSCGGATADETTTTAAGQTPSTTAPATTSTAAASTGTTAVGDTGVDYPKYLYQTLAGIGGEGFDVDKWKATAAADTVVAQMRNSFLYSNEMDPAVLAYWDALGIKKELHDVDDPALKWASYTPVAALEAGNTTKYPVVFCFGQEGIGVADLGGKEGYITVCPGNPATDSKRNGTEGPTPAGKVVWILDALDAQGYPIDRSRVYLTGMSIGGMASAWAGLESPEVVTAIAMHSSAAALNTDASGLGQVKLSIAESDFAKAMDYDVPMLLVVGDVDMGQLPFKTEGIISGLNLWLQIDDCPTQLTLADSLAAQASTSDPAVKLIGVEGDKTWTQTIDGVVYHAVDYFRADGTKMVEIVGVENNPHWVSAAYADLAWEFMSRFSKDAEGNLIVAH